MEVSSVGNQIWITEKINILMEDKIKELGPGIKKEGFAHAILLLKFRTQ